MNRCEHRVVQYKQIASLIVTPRKQPVYEYVCNTCGDIVPRQPGPCFEDGKADDRSARIPIGEM